MNGDVYCSSPCSPAAYLVYVQFYTNFKPKLAQCWQCVSQLSALVTRPRVHMGGKGLYGTALIAESSLGWWSALGLRKKSARMLSENTPAYCPLMNLNYPYYN